MICPEGTGGGVINKYSKVRRCTGLNIFAFNPTIHPHKQMEKNIRIKHKWPTSLLKYICSFVDYTHAIQANHFITDVRCVNKETCIDCDRLIDKYIHILA